jgi:hypothetical protein
MNNTESNIKTGTIFRMSWGYDQTNVNFFQVTRMTPKGVYVREINYESVEGSQGMMCQNVVPIPNSFKQASQWMGKGYSDNNPETFRKVSNGCFSIRSRYFAFLWDGKPTFNSWYA